MTETKMKPSVSKSNVFEQLCKPRVWRSCKCAMFVKKGACVCAWQTSQVGMSTLCWGRVWNSLAVCVRQLIKHVYVKEENTGISKVSLHHSALLFPHNFRTDFSTGSARCWVGVCTYRGQYRLEVSVSPLCNTEAWYNGLFSTRSWPVLLCCF